MEYRHTQSGPAAGYVAVVGVAAVGVAAFGSARAAALTAAAAAAILALASVFSRMTVTVGDGKVSAAFGFGWPRRTIPLSSVASFRAIRSKWYYGWGMRWVPGGSMFNVWGLNAVELILGSGRRFWIGSDEPGDLVAALTLHTRRQPGEADPER